MYFPGGPVVRTPSFHCRGQGFHPLVRELRSHMPSGVTKNKTKLLQSCLTLHDPIDGSPQAPLSLGFSRQEHWSGLPFPSPMHACMLNCFSRVQLCATPWTAAHQAPLSTEFSRQEYWSGLPFLYQTKNQK